MALRRQIYDQKEEIKQKDEELFQIKRDVRNTKHMEYEAENNILMNECVRLRAIIDQLFGQMGPDALNEANTADGSTPQRRERSKDDMIQNLLQANDQFQKVDQEKDHKILEMQDQLADLDDRLSRKIKELQDTKRNNVKMIKTKNKELQQLKHQLDTNKQVSAPVVANNDIKDKNKEATAKLDKELTRLKAELKRFKENDKKLRTQISELEQEKKDSLYEIKELKRKINANETKIELLKKRETELEKTVDAKSSMSIRESQKSQLKANSDKPYENNPGVDDSYNNKIPEMKPIISPDSEDEKPKDKFDFDDDSDDQNEDYDKKDDSKHEIQNLPKQVQNNAELAEDKPESEHDEPDQKYELDDEIMDHPPKPDTPKQNSQRSEEKDAFAFEVDLLSGDENAPVETKTKNKHDEVVDDYSEDKYDSDADIVKEPEPTSENDKTKSEVKVHTENIISESINDKSQDIQLPTEENGDEGSNDQNIQFIEQTDPVGGEESDDQQVEDEYEQENFENPISSERVETKPFQNDNDENNSDYASEQHQQKHNHEVEENEEDDENEDQDENGYEDKEEPNKDNPIIEEEKANASQEENPYEQHPEGEYDDYKIDQEPGKPGMENNNQQQEGEGEGDFDLSDEEMFQIAENALLKVAHCFLIRGTTVNELFNNHITEVQFEEHRLPVISPEIFIEGLKVLEIENMTELELACLMNVLVKPQLENGILVEELESIIENAPQILNNMVGFVIFILI